MTITVQNNTSALLALQQLNRTTDQLSDVNDQISTTTAVSEAKDNPSVWATAQGQQSDVDTLQSVTSSLNRATSISDVALSGGQTVLTALNSMKTDALSAQDNTLDTAGRSSLNADFTALLSQITNTINTSDFDGANLLNGTGGNLRFMTSTDVNQSLTLPAYNLSLGGSVVTVGATASINTAAAASAVLAQVEASITNVSSAMTDIGNQSKMIDAHSTLVSTLSTVLQTSHGDLIDADVAADSARLQALQTQQQLSEQSLNMANAMPSVLLNLFK